jgi:hypothetical protein
VKFNWKSSALNTTCGKQTLLITIILDSQQKNEKLFAENLKRKEIFSQ